MHGGNQVSRKKMGTHSCEFVLPSTDDLLRLLDRPLDVVHLVVVEPVLVQLNLAHQLNCRLHGLGPVTDKRRNSLHQNTNKKA